MIELTEETANMLRGMCMDPRIPQDTKEALWSRVHRLDAAVAAALESEYVKPLTDERMVRFMGVDPLDITRGAALPMIRDSWRFGFTLVDGNKLLFGLRDDGPLVAYEAGYPEPQDAVSAAFGNICGKPGA